MIRYKILIQPFATVLTGILIFVTLERGFKWASIEERIVNYVDLAKKASESVNAYDVIGVPVWQYCLCYWREFLILILY